MFRFKKAGSFLSVLTVFVVVAGSFPVQALAEVYTGELRLPNTRVLPDYGGGPVSMASFNNGYFPSAPSFSERESNNFMTSLPQKVFSASIRDGVLNCGSNDVNLNPANNSIVLTGTGYANDEAGTAYPTLCQPTAVPPTVQNTVLANTGSGNSYGGLGVTQTYDALTAFSLGESMQNTSVESIPNDPNNVRVTVSENVTQEAYGMHFERRGDVERVLNGDWRLWFEDNGLYEDGKTYIINWTSNWVGQVPISTNDDYGTVIWGDPYAASYDGDSGRTTYDTLLVNTGYPTPQITQIGSIAPALVSSSVVRPRNSDIVSITQPVCTRWTDGNFWRTVQHVYCLTDALSADGRTGHAIYYDSVSSSGWFQEFLGVSLAVAGFATIGTDFGISGLINQALGSGLSATFGAGGAANFATAIAVAQGASSAYTLAAIATMTAGSVAAISGPSALGTVESSDGLGVGTWTWSAPPAFASTTPGVGDNDLCLNIAGIQTTVPDGYTREAGGNCVPNVCPNGATNYPVCTVINVCLDQTANNFGRALPCTYSTCQDRAANNFGGRLPCTYTLVNGSCSSPARHYSCTTGTSASNVENASAWTWNCNGTNGGNNAACTEPKPPVWQEYCTGGSDPFGHSWQIWRYDNSNPPNYEFVRANDPACAPPTTVVWTNYCTGGNDPFGHSWQIWRYDNSTPTNYEFVGIDLTTCGPLTKIDGACRADHWNCITGESANNTGGTSGPWTWSCEGSNGGLDVSCSQSTGRGGTGGTGGTGSTGSTGTGSCVVRGGVSQRLCSGSSLVSYNNCGTVVDSQPCPYGCSGGACRLPSPITFTPFTANSHVGTQTTFEATGNLQVRPVLVKKGEPTWLYWNVQDASSCTVNSSANAVDSWNALSSGADGRRSQPIQGHTVFTLHCTPLSGDPSLTDITETQAVDVAPIFQEL